ncbi:MATE family efflux transporter [Lachnoclostridium phytofermentans]|uniref:Multidrug export protein MepA n=1 Tax=Lachnoclostridium phytofermentans (strain ATCC 700394 / DSM 18823 / ISDg) TaxID=357809 RepID=A9KLM1_LACP7|nr:MATE family efflux transporter [Lachnoclostridium phytofermentans]ABX42765.1 MATE efflux family protein [Lachnoclostridium phytofermentans ISDg]
MKQLDLKKDSTRKLFFRYLLPSISATLVTSIYILADSIMIGKGVGPEGIAALNIVLPLFTLFFGTGLLFGVGGSVLMSIANGSNDSLLGKQYFTTSVLSVTFISIFLLIIMQLGFKPILYFLGATDVTFTLASEYGRTLVAGAPVFMFSALLQAFIRNDKDPNLSMIGVITGGVTNIILDYIFIYIFHWGMFGGAIATVIGSSITCLILIVHFFKKTNQLKLVKNGFSMKRFSKVVTSGLASFLIEISNGIVTFLFNIQLVKYIGDIGITVYSIIANSSFIVMSLANGVAQASQPILAINFGAGERKRVDEVKHLGFITTTIIGSIIVALGALFPGVITGLFVHATDEILSLAIPAIRMYILAFLFMNLNIFISGYFQAVMKPQYAMGVNLLRGLILGSAFVLILPLFIGANGIWISMPIVETISFAVALALNYKMKKVI